MALRIYSLSVVILAVASAAVAQTVKDPILRHRSTRTERRLQATGGGGRDFSSGMAPGAKASSVEAQLNQIEREKIKAPPPPPRHPASSAGLPRTNGSSASPTINFQYHQPKATATRQAAAPSSRSQSGVHRPR